jgi:hypothetical protein
MTEAQRRFCRICYILGGTAASIAAFFTIFVLGNRSPVVKYGGAGSVRIESALTREPTIASGEAANICFSGLQWLRRCDTVVVEQLEVGGVIYNLPVHRVSPSPYASKCRPLGVLVFPREFKGDVKFSGTAISTCWPTDRMWPIETSLPDAHFTVK